jgi:predicted nuclease of predicted toxin-antitoxin system
LKLKIDENLPADCAVILRDAGFEADTVFDERLVGADDSVIASRRPRAEDRILVTLDLDFSNIRAYPPSQHAGIIVLRPKRQDKRIVLMLMGRLILALANRAPTGELWIVEADRIRFRVQ